MCFNRPYAKHAAVLAVALLALGGCNTAQKHIGEDDPYFGDSVKYDTALQTINPDPSYPPSAARPGDSGDKGAHAVRRYRTDAVKAVEATQTSTGSR
ncbi:MAG TPA: hypothetical protein VGU01_12845 [Sphingomicrobium sp.]|nr:hypothetical protein [Sphingomicrobium sp.]